MIEYVSSNFIFLLELFGLLLLLHASVHVSKWAVRVTLVTILLLFLNSVFINLEEWTCDYDNLRVLRSILTYTIYSMQPVILIMTMMIASPLKKKELWTLIPEAIAVPVYFSSYWTHVVCWFDENNSYHGGYVTILPYLVFGFYVVVFMMKVFFNSKQNMFRDASSMLIIIVVGILGVLLYLITDYSNDYSAIFATAILLYYLYYYINLSKIDSLTGLKNRKCYYRDLERAKRSITAVASVDMNDLKFINDTKGHAEGDKAIKTVADCLAVSGTRKTVYRVGGDEFIILYGGKGDEMIADDIAYMRAKISETPYVCAFGYALVKDYESIELAVTVADKAMYEDKAALKRESK
ncbi:MAG: GGDEF domain-containing protein [Clostridia bacterium]|nr:GGDEF domain-containing protein [Clostridia bacterium]